MKFMMSPIWTQIALIRATMILKQMQTPQVRAKVNPHSIFLEAAWMLWYLLAIRYRAVTPEVVISANADVAFLVEAAGPNYTLFKSFFLFSGLTLGYHLFLWEGEGMELEVKSGNKFCEGI
jgi:hypothetical protein